MTERLRVLSENCPNCGAALMASEKTASLHCDYCGSRIIIDWEGRIGGANYLALAKTDFVLGHWDKAKDRLEKALEINPNLGEAWLWRGLLAVYALPYYLERAGFTNEDIVASFVSAGKVSRDRFYSLSQHLTEQIFYYSLDRPEDQKIVYLSSFARVAACSLEAVRRLDPKFAAKEAERLANLTALGTSPWKGTSWWREEPRKRDFLAFGLAYSLDPDGQKKVEQMAQNYMELRVSEDISKLQESDRRFRQTTSLETLALVKEGYSTMMKEYFYESIRMLAYPPSLPPDESKDSAAQKA